MIYKSLGQSGEKISAVGFGTGFHSPENDDCRSLESSIRSALDAGVNFIDTAPVYGDGRSEKSLGKILKKIPRSEVFLASKVSPGNTTFSGVIESVESSLLRLQTDRIDLCQVHWPSATVPIEETMRAMEQLARDGKIRYIGVSNFLLDEVSGAMEVLKDNSLASIQSEYNFFDRSVEKNVLPFCQKNAIMLIAYSPLSQGNLANGKRQKMLLYNLAKKYNSTPGQIVLRWLINDPNVVVIPNTSKASRAKENAEAAAVFISREDINLLSDTMRTPIELIDTKEINPSGDYNRKVYQTVQEAIDNDMNMSPSPLELSEQMKEGSFLKPIRLKELSDTKNGKRYDLVEGRLRYWSWVIAHGWEKPVPALVWRKEE